MVLLSICNQFGCLFLIHPLFSHKCDSKCVDPLLYPFVTFTSQIHLYSGSCCGQSLCAPQQPSNHKLVQGQVWCQPFVVCTHVMPSLGSQGKRHWYSFSVQVQDGDMISIDASTRQMNMDVSDAELQQRPEAWQAPPYKSTQGMLYNYIKNVSSASLGCVTDL